jgi:hypothetical protein
VLLDITLAILFTEAITELVVKSEIFEPIRKFFFNRNKFIHSLLECGYCFSVWAAFLALILTLIQQPVASLFMLGVVIHRLSNVVHFVIDRVNGNR